MLIFFRCFLHQAASVSCPKHKATRLPGCCNSSVTKGGRVPAVAPREHRAPCPAPGAAAPQALGSSPAAPLQPPHQEMRGWRFVQLAK